MKNINFNEQINLFLENKAKEALDMCTQESTYMRSHNACTRRHNPACACRVQETKQGKFSALKIEIWNESHIVWEPFQTPIFTI